MSLQCLRFRRKHLGIENPETRQTLNNLASLYFLHSHFVKAEPRLLECLKVQYVQYIRLTVVSAPHPHHTTPLQQYTDTPCR